MRWICGGSLLIGIDSVSSDLVTFTAPLLSVPLYVSSGGGSGGRQDRINSTTSVSSLGSLTNNRKDVQISTPSVEKQSTDTQWMCKTGEGSWNWRTKIPIELPIKSREVGCLKIQLW